MMNPSSAEFFETKYQAKADPWNFETNLYELQRYDTVLRFLGEVPYRCACEPGCSVGVLTAKLAERCDRVLAFDISATAVDKARVHCAAFDNVELWQGNLTDFDTSGTDLMLLCEIGYYFSAGELSKIMRRALGAMERGSTLVACHWLGNSEDHVLSGDEVHETLMRIPLLRHDRGERHAGFRLDRWTVEATS